MSFAFKKLLLELQKYLKIDGKITMQWNLY